MKVPVIQTIDDASRFIVGVDVFFNDTFLNLMSVIRSAVAKFGVPKIFNFDNGSAYRNKQMELLAARIGSAINYCRPYSPVQNKQMELLAARIGSAINYCRPYSPVQKAKIERWFRTLKDQWMAALDMRDFGSLDELRGSLQTYVHMYNQSPHASLSGSSPQERFFSEPELIRRIPEEQIEKSFLLEIERRVSADSVIVIDHVEYEVDYHA